MSLTAVPSSTASVPFLAVGLPPFSVFPEVVLIALVAAGGWVWAVRQLGPRRVKPGERVVSRPQVVGWWTGLVLLFFAASWPIHPVGEEYLLWVHMIQHWVFSFIAPPLLLLNVPQWFYQWAGEHRSVAVLFRTVGRPLPAWVIFNVVNAASHIPVVVETSVTNGPFHFLVHLLLFATSMFMWVGFVNETPVLPRMSGGMKMLALMFTVVMPILPTAFLALSPTPVYHHYATAPRMIPTMNAVQDQQLASFIMATLDGFTILAWTMYWWFAWFRKNEREDRRRDRRPPRPVAGH